MSKEEILNKFRSILAPVIEVARTNPLAMIIITALTGIFALAMTIVAIVKSRSTPAQIVKDQLKNADKLAKESEALKQNAQSDAAKVGEVAAAHDGKSILTPTATVSGVTLPEKPPIVTSHSTNVNREENTGTTVS